MLRARVLPLASSWSIWPVLGLKPPQGQRHLWPDLHSGHHGAGWCRCPWFFSLAAAISMASSSAWAFSGPCPLPSPQCLVSTRVVTSGDLPQSGICQLSCCGWDPELNHLPPKPPQAPPRGPGWGTPAPALFLGCPGLWSISLGPGGAVEGSQVPGGSGVAQA